MTSLFPTGSPLPHQARDVPGTVDDLQLLLVPTLYTDSEKHRGSVRPLDKALSRHPQLLALGNQTSLHL